MGWTIDESGFDSRHGKDYFFSKTLLWGLSRVSLVHSEALFHKAKAATG
jgi:hypothetical protein